MSFMLATTSLFDWRTCIDFDMCIIVQRCRLWFYPVLDLCSHCHEGLLYICGILCTCLQEGNSKLVSILLYKSKTITLHWHVGSWRLNNFFYFMGQITLPLFMEYEEFSNFISVRPVNSWFSDYHSVVFLNPTGPLDCKLGFSVYNKGPQGFSTEHYMLQFVVTHLMSRYQILICS